MTGYLYTIIIILVTLEQVSMYVCCVCGCVQHKAIEILKWEESKKWQKKVDTLKSRLTEKQKDLERALKSVHSLKEMLGR